MDSIWSHSSSRPTVGDELQVQLCAHHEVVGPASRSTEHTHILAITSLIGVLDDIVNQMTLPGCRMRPSATSGFLFPVVRVHDR